MPEAVLPTGTEAAPACGLMGGQGVFGSVAQDGGTVLDPGWGDEQRIKEFAPCKGALATVGKSAFLRQRKPLPPWMAPFGNR